MLWVQRENEFKLAVRRGLDMGLLRRVMEDPENDIHLDEKYRNHALTGNYAGHSECHVQPFIVHLWL
ncbi:hypothetical protein CEB3_c26740 [Peptococcaceae bacterium CEB3]|nr:hypothetical protein CEB3_c26740 [Peptococcaceae bacterium CEB3]